jgi:hypothetical protein
MGLTKDMGDRMVGEELMAVSIKGLMVMLDMI